MKKRKIILLSILIILILSTNTYAIGNIDGHDWRELEQDRKITYIKGLIDGFNLMMVGMMTGLDSEGDTQAVIEQLENDGSLIVLENEKDYNKVVNRINEIYSNKSNLDKTISDLVMDEMIKLDEK